MSYSFLNLCFFLSLFAIPTLVTALWGYKKENKKLEKELKDVKGAWNEERLSLYKLLNDKEVDKSLKS